MVRIIADEFLSEERDRKLYADQYTCCPPPLFILCITLIEVSRWRHRATREREGAVAALTLAGCPPASARLQGPPGGVGCPPHARAAGLRRARGSLLHYTQCTASMRAGGQAELAQVLERRGRATLLSS